MSPIIVNAPGSSLDTAGRGVAAAQQYRAGEQQMRQRDEAFEFEKATTLRKIQFAEERQDFEREQLAQQQSAEADLLLGKAIEGGAQIGNPEAYRAILEQTSPRFRGQMLEDLGRAERVRMEQAELDAVMGELELTPETQSKVETGQLRDVGAIKRSAAAERQKIARVADQEQARLGALEDWQAWAKDPKFDMPDESMDPEAYGDVMEILGELSEGAATNPKTNYRHLYDQLMLLTTKGMRAAAMAVLQRDMGGVDVRGLPRDSRRNAMSQPAFQGEVEQKQTENNTAKADAQRTRQNAMDDPGYAARQAKGGSGAAPAQASAPGSVAEIDASAVAGGKVDESRDALIRTAMASLGLKKTPAKGTPERAKLAAEIKRLEDEQKAAKTEPDPYGGGGPPTFSQ